MRKILLLTGIACLAVGCSSISEESCIAGSWESLGYEDGREGESRGHFNKIAETCAKYGITANATEYRMGYDQGLPLYCSYDKGLDHGESGSSVKQECLEISAAPYLDGYDEGRIIYEIRQGRDDLISEYDEIAEDIRRVDREFAEEDTTNIERASLRRNRRMLLAELDDIRIDIRAYELVHDLPKSNLDVPIPPWDS